MIIVIRQRTKDLESGEEAGSALDRNPVPPGDESNTWEHEFEHDYDDEYHHERMEILHGVDIIMPETDLMGEEDQLQQEAIDRMVSNITGDGSGFMRAMSIVSAPNGSSASLHRRAHAHDEQNSEDSAAEAEDLYDGASERTNERLTNTHASSNTMIVAGESMSRLTKQQSGEDNVQREEQADANEVGHADEAANVNEEDEDPGDPAIDSVDEDANEPVPEPFCD